MGSLVAIWRAKLFISASSSVLLHKRFHAGECEDKRLAFACMILTVSIASTDFSQNDRKAQKSMNLIAFCAIVGTREYFHANSLASKVYKLPGCLQDARVKTCNSRFASPLAKLQPPRTPSDEQASRPLSDIRGSLSEYNEKTLSHGRDFQRMKSVELPQQTEWNVSDHVRLSRKSALVLLNSVAVLWGSQHAVIKLALTHSDMSPATLSFMRFALAAVAVIPFVPRSLPVLRVAAGPGLELGFWMFLGYAAQAVGLLSTTAARSGFLLYLNVKLVPLFAAILYKRRISKRVWMSALLAFVGTGLLSYDGSPPNVGDVWSILAAAASAMFILRMERATGSLDANPNALNSFALSTVAVLSGLWLWITGELTPDSVLTDLPSSLTYYAPIVYLGLVTTALSNWLQALGQRAVPAEQAAIIFAMDPVYGALFAYLLLGEHFGGQGLAGVALIGIAAFVSNRRSFSTRKNRSR